MLPPLQKFRERNKQEKVKDIDFEKPILHSSSIFNGSWDGCIEPIDDVHMSQALTTNEIRSDINSESNVKDPEVGMTFPSWDAVDSYYHARVSKDKHVVVQSPIQKSPTNKTNSSKKCECPSMVYAKPNKCNEWELCTVVLEHKNHTPTPSKSRHIPKYRNEELNKCNVARNLFNANAVGVSITKIHRTLVMSESIHSFFDGYMNKTTRLCEFPQQYSYAMEVRANEEEEADANCWKYTRTLLTAFPFEAQFRDVYTDAKFKEVQVQCSRVLYVTPLEKRVVCDNVVEHLLEDIVYTRTKKKGRDCNDEEKDLLCLVYYMYNVEHVPSKFILRRWRKDIQRKHMVVKVAYHDLSKTAQVQRFDKLMVEFEHVCLKASLLDVNIDTCMELIQLMDLCIEENNTKFYESAQAGDPSLVTPESTSIGIALTFASANCSFNYEVVPGGTPNPDKSTPCQGSTMRTQNETASTSKGTTSHFVDDPDYGDDCQQVTYKTFWVQDLYNVPMMERWNFPTNTPIQVLYERWAQNYNENDRDLRLFHEEVELVRAKTVREAGIGNGDIIYVHDAQSAYMYLMGSDLRTLALRIVGTVL
ncbi:Protein FAR-RED ELONGATED HYPOCOTYL 3, partial [Bienertia sinuspersici]